MLILIFSAGSLIYLREVDTPGYINEILFKDAGRIFKIVENHKEYALFYQYKLAEKQEKIELIKNINQNSVNDTVLVSDENLRKALLKRFDLYLIDKINDAELIKIGQKQVKIKK